MDEYTSTSFDREYAKMQMNAKEKAFYELLEMIYYELIVANEKLQKGSEVRISPS